MKRMTIKIQYVETVDWATVWQYIKTVQLAQPLLWLLCCFVTENNKRMSTKVGLKMEGYPGMDGSCQSELFYRDSWTDGYRRREERPWAWKEKSEWQQAQHSRISCRAVSPKTLGLDDPVWNWKILRRQLKTVDHNSDSVIEVIRDTCLVSVCSPVE